MASTRCRDFCLSWVPVVLYAGFLFYLSHQPQTWFPIPTLSDKLMHLIFYFPFGFLVMRALRPEKKGWRFLMALLAVGTGSCAYGLSDEIHQIFVPTRVFDFRDLLMDTLGGSLGGAFFLTVYRGLHECFKKSATGFSENHPGLESVPKRGEAPRRRLGGA